MQANPFDVLADEFRQALPPGELERLAKLPSNVSDEKALSNPLAEVLRLLARITTEKRAALVEFFKTFE